MAKTKTKGTNVITLIKNLFFDIKTHWKVPKKGDYVSYKEFAYFIVGSAGSNSAQGALAVFSFAASCFLVGSIYNIDFRHIAAIGFINLPLGYIMNPINMIIQDNLGRLSRAQKIGINSTCLIFGVVGLGLMFVSQTMTEAIMPGLPQLVGSILILNAVMTYIRIGVYRLMSSKYGKFRPWVIVGGLPSILVMVLLVWLPFKSFSYPTRLWTLNAMFMLYGLFTLFCNQVGNISNVISPNTDERGRIIAFGSFVSSIVPSIMGMVLPALVMLTGGYNNINTYRWIYPFVGLLFALMTMFLGFGVKEKIIIAPQHEHKVSMRKGFKEVLKNKYFWIVNISGLANCLTVGAVGMQNILVVYSMRADWLMAVYSTLIGTAYIPGMLLAPWLMKKVGKKNMILVSKIFGLATTALTFLVVKLDSFALLIVSTYLGTLASSPAGIATQAMQGDMWDYQQLKSGERLDGCSGVFGLITTPITTIGALLMPALYAMIGFTSDWDILYYSGMRTSVLYITVIVGAIAGVVSIIPFFFYDLTDAKHRKIMEQLQARAVEENGGQEILESESNGIHVSIEDIATENIDVVTDESMPEKDINN